MGLKQPWGPASQEQAQGLKWELRLYSQTFRNCPIWLRSLSLKICMCEAFSFHQIFSFETIVNSHAVVRNDRPTDPPVALTRFPPRVVLCTPVGQNSTGALALYRRGKHSRHHETPPALLWPPTPPVPSGDPCPLTSIYLHRCGFFIQNVT